LLTSTLTAPASALGVIEGVSDARAGVARSGEAPSPTNPPVDAPSPAAGTPRPPSSPPASEPPPRPGRSRSCAPAHGPPDGSAFGNALVADVVPPEAYGRAYGFERAMDNLGAIGGPMLALALVASVGTRWAIGLSVVPGLLAAVAIVYAIRHTDTPIQHEGQPLRIKVRPVLGRHRGRCRERSLGANPEYPLPL
jgi:Major Facilitator Superfamily